VTETAINGNGASASVHLVLQGKGGVGKSFVAAILAQYFRTKSVLVQCNFRAIPATGNETQPNS
jgi:Mrp family chromosome partitioning ATPase